jgi:hypothetical protein
MTQCQRCGSAQTVELPKVFRNGSKHVEVRCEICRAHIKYQKQPMTMERALALVLPVGKYKGKTISEVLKLDKDYLKWIAGNWTNKNYADAVSLVVS